MIAFIKGTIQYIEEDTIVLENNGMGYEIRVPFSVIEQLPAYQCEIKLYTYLYVREDAMNLYGFLNREDLKLFQLLIKVNGIGPKGALGILSTISPDDLRFAILSEDVKTISKAPGIGGKTASKLILELKDKLKLEDAFESKLADTEKKESSHGTNLVGQNGKQEAIQALTALGYSNTEAMKAVGKIQMTEDMQVEDILKLSLKNIGL